MGRSTVPDLGEGLTHHYLIFSKTDTACTQHKMGMALYLGGVHCPCNTVIVLSYVTNITSNIHLHNCPLSPEQRFYPICRLHFWMKKTGSYVTGRPNCSGSSHWEVQNDVWKYLKQLSWACTKFVSKSWPTQTVHLATGLWNPPQLRMSIKCKTNHTCLRNPSLE